MKNAGWLGIVLIALGVLMVWAGFQNVTLGDVLRSLLNGEALPGQPGANTVDTTSGAVAGRSGNSADTKNAGQERSK